MTRAQRFRMLLFLLLAFAIPAYANNPPQPDGLFSVLLIFPIAIIGARLAGLVRAPKSASARIIGRIAVGVLCTLLLMAGTLLGALVALGILVYAIVRGSKIIRRGRSAHRAVIGAVVMAFAVFAFADYWASIVSFYSPEAAAEASAVSGVRSLSIAESEFAKSSQSGHAPSGAAGMLKDLENAKLIDGSFSNGQLRKGYRYGEIVDPAKGRFLFYAIPAPELKPGSFHGYFVPGTSLIKSIRGVDHEEGTGYRSFAVDETGVIRTAIRTQTGPVTREEAQDWSPL
jgi:hypothetical protein